jgi:MFS family permease
MATLQIESLGPLHRRLFLLCGFSWGVGGSAWFSTLQFLLPAVKGWKWPDSYQGVYPGILYVGMALGAQLFGRIGDTRGRRPALLWALVISSLFGFLAAVAPNPYFLCAALLGQV